MTLQRAAVPLVAALAIAWLGVSYSNARKIGDAQAVVGNLHATTAQVDAALATVRSAGALDPGTGAERLSYEASLEIRAKRLPEALRLLEEIVRREPDTAEAWLLIAQLTRTSDPARSAEARAELHRLDPQAVPAQP